MSLKNKLNRMKQHMTKEQNTLERQLEESNREFDKDWEDHQTTVFSYDGQQCLVREVTYPLDTYHGNYKLGEFHKVVSMWNESEMNHPLSCKGHTAPELFFFDTETTGLGGGVGNTIFLLGQAQVFSDKVVVKQHLLPQPGNEVALYQSFLQGINSKTLVTYNGKAFDWPQVKTRHTLIKESLPKLPAFGHFDLFHAARRLWKNSLESVKLANVEKEILNIHREDDVPGYLAPMIYFQFVKQQQPDVIKGVLKHNEIDVLSLITLYIHLSYKLLKTDNEASEAEHYEIARWLDYVGNNETAFTAYQSLLKKGSYRHEEAKLAVSLHYKKLGQWERAIPIWKEIILYSDDVIITSKTGLELAKYYEHKKKDYQSAIFYSELVLNKLENEEKTEMNVIVEIEKRLSRLRRKCSINIPRASAKTE